MRYIIDGYNVIKQYHSITNKQLLNGKLSFLYLLERKLSAAKIIVVFDGFPKLGSRVYNFKIEVKFSRENTADDCVKDLIKNKKKREKILLVTDDRDLINFSKSHNVQVKKVEKFLKHDIIKGEKKRENPSKPANLSLQGRKITQYLYKKLGSKDGEGKD